MCPLLPPILNNGTDGGRAFFSIAPVKRFSGYFSFSINSKFHCLPPNDRKISRILPPNPFEREYNAPPMRKITSLP
ncbi:hypothetical protein BGS_1272 [Beggiatoa sp. SS]|nr:hypothetical protein BGS_1272 [Beggiatoa sp. SS]